MHLAPCSSPDCQHTARYKTQFCSRHGGGDRCRFPGCNRAVRIVRQGLQLCSDHGLRRCLSTGCKKLVMAPSVGCSEHADTVICKEIGCRAPVCGKKGRCRVHSVRYPCATTGCTRNRRAGHSVCAKHGGNNTCKVEGCDFVGRKAGYCNGHSFLAGKVSLAFIDGFKHVLPFPQDM